MQQDGGLFIVKAPVATDSSAGIVRGWSRLMFSGYLRPSRTVLVSANEISRATSNTSRSCWLINGGDMLVSSVAHM